MMKIKKSKIEFVPLGLILLISVFSFLLSREVLPHWLRYFNFAAAFIASLYFLPFRIIKSMKTTGENVEKYHFVWDKIMLYLFAVGFAFAAILQFADTENAHTAFLVFKLITAVASIVLIFMPKFENKIEIFLNLFIFGICMVGIIA